MENVRVNESPVLFAFSGAGSFRLQRYLAAQLAKAGRSVGLLHCGARGPAFEMIKAEARQAGLGPVAHIEDFSAGDLKTAQSRLTERSLRAALLRKVARRRANAAFEAQRQALFAAAAMLEQIRPAVLVVSEDGITGPMAVVSAAKLMSVPVLDLPYGCATAEDFDNDLDRKAAANELVTAEGLEGSLIRGLSPKWIKKGHRRGTLMFNSAFTLATEAAGFQVRDPWIVHGGPADLLCVESRHAMERYASEGIPSGKLALTGSPYCDEMMEGLKADAAARDAFRSGRKIDAGHTRILITWPPSYHETYPGRSEFFSYREMTRQVLGALKAIPDALLTVSMHPACEDLSEVLEELQIVPTTQHIVRLLATHDIFVPYFSTTTNWALAAGKIAVNYDAYGIDLKQFNSAPGFLNYRNFAEFTNALRRLAATPGAYEELAARLLPVADRWGILDGRCSSRVIDAIDKLALGHDAAAASRISV